MAISLTKLMTIPKHFSIFQNKSVQCKQLCLKLVQWKWKQAKITTTCVVHMGKTYLNTLEVPIEQEGNSTPLHGMCRGSQYRYTCSAVVFACWNDLRSLGYIARAGKYSLKLLSEDSVSEWAIRRQGDYGNSMIVRVCVKQKLAVGRRCEFTCYIRDQIE